MFYGMFCMQSVKCTEITYKSAKLTKPHRVVFMSDIHYGSAQTESGVRRTLEKVKELNPDFIVLGGDVTDNFRGIEQI